MMAHWVPRILTRHLLWTSERQCSRVVKVPDSWTDHCGFRPPHFWRASHLTSSSAFDYNHLYSQAVIYKIGWSPPVVRCSPKLGALLRLPLLLNAFECFQAGENQRVLSGDEDQTRVQFSIYHIPQHPPKISSFNAFLASFKAEFMISLHALWLFSSF
jgi:hypothetical protein